MNEATRRITNYDFWKNNPTLEDVRECIEGDADLTQLVKSTSEYGTYYYSLAYCAAKHLPDAIPEMCRHGMDVNQPFPEGTAVQLASYVADVKPLGMKRLLENGADIGVEDANAGLGCPDPEGQAILDDLKQKTGFSLPSYTKVTCVGWANIEGVNMYDDPEDKLAEEQRQKVAMLFDAGIHPDAPCRDGEPPIFSYIVNGYEKATQMVLDHGGHIDARSSTGDTALTHCADYIARDFEANWVDKGVPLNDEEKSEAVCRECIKRVSLAISKGASLTATNAKGESFENGPASQIPFVAEIIKAYHKGGKEEVAKLVQRWEKEWEKKDQAEYFAELQEKKRAPEEAEKRKNVAARLKEQLAKKTEEGRGKAMDIAKDFHVEREDFSEGFEERWAKEFRPTALRFRDKINSRKE